MVAVGQIRVGATPVVEENDRPVRKTRRQIDETVCISALQIAAR
jgi:hypothetical protein